MSKEIDTMLAERVEEWTEQWKLSGMQQGIQQGKLEGMQQGRLEGETQLVERLLARRFGPPSADTQARLKTATLEQLEQWAENLLDAATLGEVFRNP